MTWFGNVLTQLERHSQLLNQILSQAERQNLLLQMIQQDLSHLRMELDEPTAATITESSLDGPNKPLKGQ